MEETFIEILMNALFTFWLLFDAFLEWAFFWLETNFLIALSFSLFMSNVIRYFRVQHAKKTAILVQVVYIVYLFGNIAVSLYYVPLQMEWWEWILTSPYLLVAFFYGLLKTTKTGRWLFNYWNMHIYYILLSIPFCIMNGGIWWGSLIYALILLIFSNLGGLYREKTME